MHCHILEHEDQGAMTWANTLVGGFGPPISPAPNYQDLYDCSSTCIPTSTSENICNGVDDDCDGQVDEDYVTTPTSCGVGECSGNTGEVICQNGAEIDTCDPFAGALAEGPFDDPTYGDALDNDCDVLTDVNDPDCDQPVDCSIYTTNTDCNNDAACRWKGSPANGTCVER